MRTTPLLVLAYNRPEKMQQVIDSLRVLKPKTLMIAVDGPKPGNAADAAKVEAVQRVVDGIDWTDDVETRFRPANLGLRSAVADAVTWAVSTHGEATIIEDDALPGPDFLPYSAAMLDRFRDDDRVAHISGYNLVPPQILGTSAGSRLTLYPESFAWSTWERAWSAYDPTLEWARNVTIAELAKITGSTVAALRWKQHFDDAAAERISTWAYRWIASMWSKGSLTLSPNANLVTYIGYDQGTHATLTAPWDELPVHQGGVDELIPAQIGRHVESDAWVGRTVFGESALGVVRGAAISALLEGRKIARRLRS